jgi:hypothetical protein
MRISGGNCSVTPRRSKKTPSGGGARLLRTQLQTGTTEQRHCTFGEHRRMSRLKWWLVSQCLSTPRTAERTLRDRSLAGPAFGHCLANDLLRGGLLGRSSLNWSRTRLRQRLGRSLRHARRLRRQMGHARRAAFLALGLVIIRDLKRTCEALAAIRGRSEALGPREMPVR